MGHYLSEMPDGYRDMIAKVGKGEPKQPNEKPPPVLSDAEKERRDQALRDQGWEYNQERGGFQRVPKP